MGKREGNIEDGQSEGDGDDRSTGRTAPLKRRRSTEAEQSDSDDERGDESDEDFEMSEEDEETSHDAVDKREVPEFRPVVVYHLSKQPCGSKGCVGLTFRLGVVHTSPEGSEFNRVAIYTKQLKKIFEQVQTECEQGVRWILVGDFYLSPEALVEKSDKAETPKSRRETGNTFEQRLPDKLKIVAAVTGTNAGMWKPPEWFQSRRMQIADFAICSTNWPFCRALPLDPADGRPMVMDVQHRAFRRMRASDGSDHSPILLFAGVDKTEANAAFRQMLGYDNVEEHAKSESSKFLSARSKRREQLDREKTTCESAVKEANTMKKYREVVRHGTAHRQLVRRLNSMDERPQGTSLFDFDPASTEW
ncbi:MAG: hypothetical protein JOZ54_12805 [Acidobacteria bacterium]|nr:hypothetical protein [Acidobacteriota bacterium]